MTKHDEIVIKTKAAVDKLYEDGRTTMMSDGELTEIIDRLYEMGVK